VPKLAAHFDAIDRDGDGRISADEVRAWRKAQARRAPRPSAVGRFLEQADADGDGLLSRDEALARLPRIGSKFARLDLDASGRLSRDEIDAWFALRRASRRR
jgi:Ca2+-binding EF-hand superfamily protein